MPSAYDLTNLDPRSFEHLSNAIAMRILGAGHTGFAPGPDGGRDGYFHGPAPYPSNVNRWDGTWYIQAKFHAPHLSHDPQKWLLDRIREELKAFRNPQNSREWPDNWIIVTNVDPTPTPKTGSFDRARTLVRNARRKLVDHFDIWGGTKLVEFLSQFPDIAAKYGHFLSPGHVISKLYSELGDARASGEAIVRHLIVSGLEDHKHTKLEQAGSEADKRPGIHNLFVDLPFRCAEHELTGLATQFLATAASQVQRLDPNPPTADTWLQWRRHPSRAPVWFIKGGPGQGKSTIGQYFCQIQRAALVLQGDGLNVHPEVRQLAQEIRTSPNAPAVWPTVPRIPIQLELKEYAKWYAERRGPDPRGVLTYVSALLSAQIEQPVAVGTLRRLLAARSWVVVFDGLDEVPAAVKDAIAKEVHAFLRDISADADVLTICTSRPQGYSGQFDSLYGVASAELAKLPESTAFKCGALLIKQTLPRAESERSVEVLKAALRSPAVQELMTTPLQSHIMAIIVRGGQRPPEKKWELYNRFYDVIRTREANRELPDQALRALLREDHALLKAVHNRLGFLLHSEAERAQGAQAKLSRADFRTMVETVVREQKDHYIDAITETVLSATTERLVLISTPDDGAHVRFDVRQLQEYFAAEYLYYGATPDALGRRLENIVGDAHWREVVHFLLSALALGSRKAELAVAYQALRSTDDGESEGLDSAFAGALARGGLVAARLLQDGVLEPDKGVRNIFKDMMPRVASIRDPNALAPLLSVRGPASEAWITDQMARYLRELDTKSSLGAALYLVLTIRDDHAFLPALLSTISAAPGWYRRALLESLVAAPTTDSARRRWVVDLLADASSQWPVPDFAGARLFARAFESHDLAKAVSDKLGERFGPRIAGIFNLYRRERHLRQDNMVREDYGWLTLAVAPSGPFDDPQIRNWASHAHPEEMTGFVGFTVAATHFACFQDKPSYLSVLSALGSDWSGLYELPSDIYMRFPRVTETTPSKLADAVASLTEEQFAHSLSARAFGHLRFEDNRIWEIGSGERDLLSNAKISALFAKYPRWAVMWWVRQVGVGEALALSGDVTNEAVTVALQTAAARRELAAPVWGLAFGASRGGAALREKVVADGFNPELGYGPWWIDDEIQFRPVVLDLPKEVRLLPRLASDVISAHNSFGTDIAFRRGRLTGRDERLQACCSLVQAYVPRARDLDDVLVDSAHPAEVRAAAALLLMLHPLGDRSAPSRYPELFTESAAVGHSAGGALALAVDLLHIEREPTIAPILGAVVEAMPGDSIDWRRWNLLLARWRERSNAPVTSKGVAHFLAE
ncbi:hypothetical protein ACOQFB_16215 [Anaeromyxobacter sp. Red801]|uniref:hypothetical protein n=1 Tax=Anaeromyxobacter sp. Red801 TaxID=3411632 RepID=UPI003BA27038